MTNMVAVVVMLKFESGDVVLPVDSQLAELESVAAIHSISMFAIAKWFQGRGSGETRRRIRSYLHDIATPSQVSPNAI